jgi:sulfate transport system ATP-binding protein
LTSLFVTHDQGEAFEVADQVIVLNRGRIEQMGPPQELYERPSTAFVTGFLGSVNVLPFLSELGTAGMGDGSHDPAKVNGKGAPISMYIRPHDLDLAHESNGRPSWAGQVVRVTPLGASVRLDVTLTDGTGVRVEVSRERYAALEQPQPGAAIFVEPRDYKVFLDQTQPV